MLSGLLTRHRAARRPARHGAAGERRAERERRSLRQPVSAARCGAGPGRAAASPDCSAACSGQWRPGERGTTGHRRRDGARAVRAECGWPDRADRGAGHGRGTAGDRQQPELHDRRPRRAGRRRRADHRGAQRLRSRVETGPLANAPPPPTVDTGPDAEPWVCSTPPARRAALAGARPSPPKSWPSSTSATPRSGSMPGSARSGPAATTGRAWAGWDRSRTSRARSAASPLW